MSRLLPAVLVVVLLVAACTGSTADTTTTVPDSTTTVPETTTSEVPVLDNCPPAPYEVGELPQRVASAQVPSEDIELDDITTAPGTHSTLWLDDDGRLAVALIRGTLPLEDFPGEKGEVSVDGARGVAGPFDDGTWMVAWFEEPRERCDLYTMVFYPPVAPSEVEATIASMNRVAG